MICLHRLNPMPEPDVWVVENWIGGGGGKKQRFRLLETKPLNVSNGASSAQVWSLHLGDKKSVFFLNALRRTRKIFRRKLRERFEAIDDVGFRACFVFFHYKKLNCISNLYCRLNFPQKYEKELIYNCKIN